MLRSVGCDGLLAILNSIDMNIYYFLPSFLLSFGLGFLFFRWIWYLRRCVYEALSIFKRLGILSIPSIRHDLRCTSKPVRQIFKIVVLWRSLARGWDCLRYLQANKGQKQTPECSLGIFDPLAIEYARNGSTRDQSRGDADDYIFRLFSKICG